MSSDQQVHNIQIDGVSSSPSENQQTEGSSDGKMMTQAEYLKYKQGDSNANNYYSFARVVDSKPVAWVNAVNFIASTNVFLTLYVVVLFLLKIFRMENSLQPTQTMFSSFPIAMRQTFRISMAFARSLI